MNGIPLPSAMGFPNKMEDSGKFDHPKVVISLQSEQFSFSQPQNKKINTPKLKLNDELISSQSDSNSKYNKRLSEF